MKRTARIRGRVWHWLRIAKEEEVTARQVGRLCCWVGAVVRLRQIGISGFHIADMAGEDNCSAARAQHHSPCSRFDLPSGTPRSEVCIGRRGISSQSRFVFACSCELARLLEAVGLQRRAREIDANSDPVLPDLSAGTQVAMTSFRYVVNDFARERCCAVSKPSGLLQVLTLAIL
jgi:hypothetical protein